MKTHRAPGAASRACSARRRPARLRNCIKSVIFPCCRDSARPRARCPSSPRAAGHGRGPPSMALPVQPGAAAEGSRGRPSLRPARPAARSTQPATRGRAMPGSRSGWIVPPVRASKTGQILDSGGDDGKRPGRVKLAPLLAVRQPALPPSWRRSCRRHHRPPAICRGSCRMAESPTGRGRDSRPRGIAFRPPGPSPPSRPWSPRHSAPC